MRRSSALVAALALVFVSSASGIESTIRPGFGIGKARIGMTFMEVKKALGAPDVLNVREQVNGHGYVEYGWQFSTFWVGFARRGGVLRAVLIGTNLKGEKTASGIGNGSTLDALRSKYDVSCRNTEDGPYDPRIYADPGERLPEFCTIGPLSTPTTVFAIGCYRRPPGGGRCEDSRIYRVIVRRASL